MFRRTVPVTVSGKLPAPSSLGWNRSNDGSSHTLTRRRCRVPRITRQLHKIDPPGVAAVEASLLEMIFAGLIVVVLISVAVYYGPRQWQALRKLRTENDLDAADRRYIHRQAWRRLVNSGLMLLLAALLVG